jgi:flavorubredoxin
MTDVTEVGPDLFRLSTFVPELDMQFSQFLVRDDEPLLFHTGLRSHFPATLAALRTVIPPEQVRWIGFSHFEADECGALAQWQAAAPHATAVCSVDDSGGLRPARGLLDGEVLETGRHRFRLLQTPHLPHCWEAAMLFEETRRTLFCSDLFHHNGNVAPITSEDVVEPFRAKLLGDQPGPFAFYMPWTPQTEPMLHRLAALGPRTLAIMHGSVFVGDGARALRSVVDVMKDVLGGPAQSHNRVEK